MAATIRDVAQLAGVSTSTVSRLLNNKASLSENTRQRIYGAIEQLNYVPNDQARGFATGKAFVIALVIDVGESGVYFNTFFNNTVAGIETAAHENGYNLMITNMSSTNDASSIEKLVLSKKIDGMILPVSLAGPNLISRLARMSFPCAVLGRGNGAVSSVNTTDINNYQAGVAAALHLVEGGYKKLAFISDGEDKQFNIDRLNGVRHGLEEMGLALSPDMIIETQSTVEDGLQAVMKLMNGLDCPDGIICSSDRLALGAVRAAKRLGKTVPNEIGVLSFDNTPLTELMEPGITSIEVDTFKLGVKAAEMLIRQIDDPDTSPEQTLLSTRVITRESTSKAD